MISELSLNQNLLHIFNKQFPLKKFTISKEQIFDQISGINFGWNIFLKRKFQWMNDMGIFNLWEYFSKILDRNKIENILYDIKLAKHLTFKPQNLDSNFSSVFIIISIGLIISMLLFLFELFLKNIYNFHMRKIG